MTENEAIKILTLSPQMKKEIPNLAEVYDVAVKALEEIQQYRAIGTTAEIIGQQYELQTYQAIGTIEEFKALKDENKNVLLKDGQLLYQQGIVDGYDKAIDEFASALTNKDNMLEHDIDEIMTSFHSYDLACNYFREYVDYVAEQLKDGA